MENIFIPLAKPSYSFTVKDPTGKLRSNIASAFLRKITIPLLKADKIQTRPEGTDYEIFYDFSAGFPDGMEIGEPCSFLASFQKHKDGKNIVVLRFFEENRNEQKELFNHG